MRESKLGTMFKFDPSWRFALNDYDGETVKAVINALCEWRETGEIPDSLTGEPRATLKFIIVNIERMDEWSGELSEARSRAGKIGGGNPNFKKGQPNPYYINKDKQDKQDKQTLSNINKDKQDKLPILSYPNPNVIKRDRQAISLSQETRDDTSKTIRKQKLLNNEEVKEVANYYNAQIKETGANFAQCINVDGQRASLISARIKQYGKENVKLAINKIFASKWIAENTKTSVRNITWIMKPENCRKILEGNYDNDKQPAPSTSQPKRHYDDNTSDDFKITEYWNKYNETH